MLAGYRPKSISSIAVHKETEAARLAHVTNARSVYQELVVFLGVAIRLRDFAVTD